jgi:hypothetical protein
VRDKRLGNSDNKGDNNMGLAQRDNNMGDDFESVQCTWGFSVCTLCAVFFVMTLDFVALVVRTQDYVKYDLIVSAVDTWVQVMNGFDWMVVRGVFELMVLELALVFVCDVVVKSEPVVVV